MLYQILVFIIHGKIYKKSYKKSKFKISAPTWNEEFVLPDGSYSISDIQDYFEFILKKRREKTVNPSVKIYINKLENRITFKIKIGYYRELLTPETIKLFGSTKSWITKKRKWYKCTWFRNYSSCINTF